MDSNTAASVSPRPAAHTDLRGSVSDLLLWLTNRLAIDDLDVVRRSDIAEPWRQLTRGRPARRGACPGAAIRDGPSTRSARSAAWASRSSPTDDGRWRCHRIGRRTGGGRLCGGEKFSDEPVGEIVIAFAD